MSQGSIPAVDTRTVSSGSARGISPRAAGRAVYASVVTMLASMVAISLFFGGAGDFWGPLNDLLVMATVLLLLPAIVVLPRLAAGQVGSWFVLLSAATVVGVLVIAAGQLALVAGSISLDASFLTGGLGVVPLVAWIGCTVWLGRRTSVLSRATGWWAAGFVSLVALTVVTVALVPTDMGTLTTALGVPLAVALCGWLVSLGRSLSASGAH